MTDHTEGKLEVRAIENGTVIDHIPSDCLFKIIKILDLEHDTHRITCLLYTSPSPRDTR